jgi:ABC-type glycerol-3-phosphate transport system substrate-binding protein
MGSKVFTNKLRTKAMCLSLSCLTICFYLFFLPGCGGTAPTPAPMTITFACDFREMAYYESLIQVFRERSPHITITLRPWRWIEGAASTGALDYSADVNVAFSHHTARHVEGQINMLDLTALVESDASLDLSDFYPGTVELFTGGGAVWAIPTGVDLGVMYYDRGLFDQYGVSYPEIGWTRDDFLDRALALRDPEAGVFGYGMRRPTLNDARWFVYLHGGQIVDDLLDPTQTTFDDPLNIEALEWYADLLYKYGVAPTREQASDFGFPPSDSGAGAVDLGFVSGKVGMLMGRFSEKGGIWVLSGAPWTRPWGMATVPRDARSSTLAWGEGLAISGETQYPEACWQWVLFLSEQLPRRTIPARRSIAESDEFDRLVGGDIAAVARASIENALPVYYRAGDMAYAIFDEAITDIVNGDALPDEAMAWAQRESERSGP